MRDLLQRTYVPALLMIALVAAFAVIGFATAMAQTIPANDGTQDNASSTNGRLADPIQDPEVAISIFDTPAATSSSTSGFEEEPNTTDPAGSTQTDDTTQTTVDSLIKEDQSIIAATESDTFSKAPTIKLNCGMAYTADLYDTRSGHEETGAAIIGTQSWTVCKDSEDRTYEFKITSAEYDAFSLTDSAIPQKTLSIPLSSSSTPQIIPNTSSFIEEEILTTTSSTSTNAIENVIEVEERMQERNRDDR